MTIALSTDNNIITGYVLLANQDYTDVLNEYGPDIKLYFIPDNISTNMIRTNYTTLEDLNAKLL